MGATRLPSLPGALHPCRLPMTSLVPGPLLPGEGECLVDPVLVPAVADQRAPNAPSERQPPTHHQHHQHHQHHKETNDASRKKKKKKKKIFFPKKKKKKKKKKS